MKKLLNIKNLFGILLIILSTVLLFTFFKTCNDTEKIIESKTVTIHDTSYLLSPIVTIPEYIPIKDTIYLDTITRKLPIPSIDLAQLTIDYKNLVNKHYSNVLYKDSIKLKDDSLFKDKDLGSVYIDDVITENELIKRNIRYQLKYPVVTTTIITTNTVEAKKRNQVYIGAQFIGGKQDFVNQANILLLLKNKRDFMFGLSAGGLLLDNKVSAQYGVTILKKIKL